MKQIVFFTQVLNEHVVIGPTTDQALQQRIDETRALLSSTRPGTVSFIEIRGVVPVVTGGIDLNSLIKDQASVQNVSALQRTVEEAMIRILSSAGVVQH